MNTEQLYAFRTAYECRSFTKAAGLLCKSQSAVTQLIRSLEKELNADLFIRHTRPVKPTEAGERFYPYAVNILRLAEESIEVFASGHAGRLSLYYMATFVGVMDQYLASDQNRTALNIIKIPLDDFIRTDNWQPGNLYLVRKETVKSKNIVTRPAYVSDVYAEVPVHSGLAGKNAITLDDLRSVTAVLPPVKDSTSLTAHLRKLFTEAGGITIRSIGGVENGLMYAIMNDGICFCTDEFNRPKEQIRYVPFPKAGKIQYCFAALNRFSQEMKAFMDGFDNWYAERLRA